MDETEEKKWIRTEGFDPEKPAMEKEKEDRAILYTGHGNKRRQAALQVSKMRGWTEEDWSIEHATMRPQLNRDFSIPQSSTSVSPSFVRG